jgi:hypothetical protein
MRLTTQKTLKICLYFANIGPKSKLLESLNSTLKMLEW